MKALMRYSNSHYGNKGMIFTLDVAVGVIIFVLLLGLSSYYISTSQELRDVDFKIIRTGSDVLAYLHHTSVLQTMDIDDIENSRDSILPSPYDLKIKIECEDSSGSSSGSVETSEIIPDDRFVSSGKRVFARDNDNYCLARFFIWRK